ncbi:MAG: site-2 protease family protein [Dehalococcoidales bacterium]|nr:site-2 protease family protein [Dehalococcoidales bacterium]
MKSSFRLFRIAGIDIGLHYTWIFIFVLISWSLAQGFFPQAYPGWDTVTYWITGILAALLLFVSVLLHEMAHSLVARARGMSVNSITLFIFGGVSNLEEEPEKPRIEFAMAIVGPLTSLALAGIFWGLTQVAGDQDGPLAAMLSYLSLINLILAIFNILPGFPLDGGRVLRSILWGATGNLIQATNIAATVGRFFGWGLIAFGVLRLLAGDFLGGLWIAFIGWFISSAADNSYREITLREHLSGIKVKELMTPDQETIAPETRVEDVVWNIFRKNHGRSVPVCRDGKLLGIVTITDVKELPRDKWAETPVEQIMTRDPLYMVSPEDNLNTAMKLIAQHDINQVLINQQGRCAGLLSRSDIIRHLQLNQELGMQRKV